MPKTPTGEFEIILGNRALISIFLGGVAVVIGLLVFAFNLGRPATAPSPPPAKSEYETHLQSLDNAKSALESLTTYIDEQKKELQRRICTLADQLRGDPATAGYQLATAGLQHIRSDRYEYYFKEQKALVYDIDHEKSLSDFYQNLLGLQDKIQKNGNTLLHIFLTAAAKSGRDFCASHKIVFNPAENALERGYKDLVRDIPRTAPVEGK